MFSDRKRKRTRTPSSDSESSSTSTRSSSSDSPASSPLPTPRESSSVKKSSPPVQPPAPPIRRYYGRQKNSESPTSDEEVAEKPTSSTPSNKYCLLDLNSVQHVFIMHLLFYRPSTSSVSSAGATKVSKTFVYTVSHFALITLTSFSLKKLLISLGLVLS